MEVNGVRDELGVLLDNFLDLSATQVSPVLDEYRGKGEQTFDSLR